MIKILRVVTSTLFIVFISTRLPAQWVSKANAYKTRSEVSSVVYNGKLYAFLGFSDSLLDVEPSAEVYDPVLNTWKLLTSIAADKSMTHQGVALIDDNVWHIGGRVGKDPGPLTSKTWIYNITSNTWSAGPEIIDPATGKPVLWGGGGAAFLGRTLHLFGGFITKACNRDDDQDAYHLTLDIDDWLANPQQPAPWKNELAPLPVKRNHFGTTVLEGKIYAIGGQFGHDCEGLDMPYSHRYDPVLNKWTALPLLPSPRSHIEGATFILDGKIYITAGQAKGGRNTNRVTIFDPAANNGAGSWADDTKLTLRRTYEGLSAKVINNTFIISHGGEGSSKHTRNTTYARTIKRNPVYKFGFTGGCANLNAVTGTEARLKTLLFTIDGRKPYIISSSANWLTVNKNATGTALPNGVDIELDINTADLAQGNYKAVITATGIGTIPLYTPASYCINLTVLPVPKESILEAEQAVLGNVVEASNQPGFTGSGFADYIDSTGSFIEWTLNKDNPGFVNLNFRYANGSLFNRPLKLEINGAVETPEFAFPPTGEWANWSVVSYTAKLDSGDNKIRLTTIGYNGANIDNLAWQDTAYLPGQHILEAEEAVLNKVAVASNQPGFTGTGFADYIDSTGSSIEWAINKDKPGFVNLDFRYANGSLVNRPLKLEINGVVETPGFAFPSTGAWANWSVVSYKAKLDSGENKIKLTTIGYNGANIDNLAWQDTIFLPGQHILEAEQAVLYKVVVASNQPGFTGSGFADYIDSSGSSIEWTLDKQNAGLVTLGFRYANGSADNRPLQLEINGEVIAPSLDFLPTKGWTTWSTITFTADLVSGENKIKLTAIGAGGANMDHLFWDESAASSITTMKRTSVKPLTLLPFAPGKFSASILPNPVHKNARIFVDGMSDLPIQMIVTDILGKVHKVLTYKNLTSGYINVAVDQLPSGPYFIMIRQGKERRTIRFIIEK